MFPFEDLFQKLFLKFWFVNKHSFGEWGLLVLYGHKEILEIVLLRICPKKKKNVGYGPFKILGERSRAILALLFPKMFHDEFFAFSSC